MPLGTADPDSVSILDFGAVCDGITDDSRALRAALNVGKTVYIPSAGAPCVVGDIDLSQGHQRIFGRGAILRPAKGASRMFLVSGFANGLEGIYVQDNGNLVARTILTNSAAAGATSVIISTHFPAPSVQVGQRYSIRLDNGNWATGFVTGISGAVVTLRDPLPDGASAGNSLWSTFGLIQIRNATRYLLRDIGGANIWGGILVDSPDGSTDKGHIDLVNFSSGIRMFGLVKGRNSSDNTFSRLQLWGGYSGSVRAVGNGFETRFLLPEQVNLTRELSLYVSSQIKTYGIDYEISNNGLSVVLKNAPADGAPVIMNYQIYGHDGLVDDGRDVTASTGGNLYSQVASLQFRRCAFLKGAQLFSITGKSIFDTCQDYALLVDGASQTGVVDALVGWASGTSLYVTGGSDGLKASDVVLAPQPPGYAVNFAKPASIRVDPGNDLTGRIYNRGAGFTDYSGGRPIFTEDQNGGRVFSGSMGGVVVGVAGDVIGFSKNGFNYFACSGEAATCVLQGATAQLQGTKSAKISIGAADAISVDSSQLKIGSVTQHINFAGGRPSLSDCGNDARVDGSDHAGRIVQGTGSSICILKFAVPFAMKPVCIVTIEDEGEIRYHVSNASVRIVKKGTRAAGVFNYICSSP